MLWLSPVVVPVAVVTWLVVVDGLGYGEVEDADADATREEHRKVGDVRKLRLLIIPTCGSEVKQRSNRGHRGHREVREK